MAQVTDRGKEWEKRNSRWIYLSFLWFTAPFGFFYIGAKAKKQLWIIVGFIYLLVIGIMFFGEKPIEEMVGNNYGGILATILVVGIVLSYKFKKEYLIRLDMLEKANVKQMEDENLRERAAAGLFKKGIPVQGPNTKVVDDIKEIKQEELQKTDNVIKSSVTDSAIDINSCSEDTLAELPGINLILAKKAINYRQENNGFASVDDFYRVVDLKPHFIAQIGNKIVCN
jgi:DNA uptake protein ComE-like DNA-binding protein